MTVTVEWFGQLRDAAGADTQRVDVAEGATVADVLRAAVAAMAPLGTLVLDDDGAPRRTLVISQDDAWIQDTAQSVSAGAVLTVMSPLSGG